MYTQNVVINSSTFFKLTGRPFGFPRGLEVQAMEDWQDLLSNVASRGCRNSFRKLFDHYFPMLISLGVKSGISKEQSTEMAQETMLKVWTHASAFDPEKGNASLWIFTIARNLRFDYFRKIKNDPLKVSSYEIYNNLDTDASEDMELEMVFDLSVLKERILHLPPEQQSIIQKIYFEGFTQEEISIDDNIPLGTVKSRIRLAISAMKEKLGEGEKK